MSCETCCCTTFCTKSISITGLDFLFFVFCFLFLFLFFFGQQFHPITKSSPSRRFVGFGWQRLVECKIFLGERKIFSSVWLHHENFFRKYFHVFVCILKMLFSQPLSQLPNKFYNRKFQYINLKKQKSKQYHSLNSNNSVKLREGSRESDQKLRERDR